MLAFKNPVVAQSERLYLSPMKVEDAPYFVKWFNDPLCFAHSRDMRFLTSLKEQSQWIEQTNQDPSMRVFSVYLSAEDLLIGDGGFIHIDDAHKSAEIGFLIGETQYWRVGLGKELRWLLCDYGFKTMGLHNILGEHFASNPISLQNALKTGAKLMGTRRQAKLLNGERIDIHYTDMLPHELIKPKPKHPVNDEKI